MSSTTRSDAANHRESASGGSNVVNGSLSSLSNSDMEAGLQPIDALMLRRNLSNHDLVVAAGDSGLTHKQVAKARRGRRLTLHMQEKIVAALNRLPNATAPLQREDCFNYRGR